MVKLPVPGGMLKVISSFTLCVPNSCTCPAGSVLGTMGREHCAGVQAPSGTQTLPRVRQHPYPSRHRESEVQAGSMPETPATGVQADAMQPPDDVHAAVQKPP